jgi:hypothetical protein
MIYFFFKAYLKAFYKGVVTKKFVHTILRCTIIKDDVEDISLLISFTKSTSIYQAPAAVSFQ